MVFFIIGSGYLLIYNVLYISISKDTRFYGLMKTLGTTQKQIKSLVKNQAVKFACIGIPIGIVLATAVSFGIVPFVLNEGFEQGKSMMDAEVFFHPSIYILSILFSAVTVWIACNAPAKAAAKISPIEALKFQNFAPKKTKSRNSTNGGKLHVMAFHNVFRDKKRAILVFMSLFMGITMILDNLIAEGEKRNIGLMFDMVFNHTSTSHEWFRRALAGEKKYQDYYIFKEGAPDQPPTNWQSKFGGSAWEYVSSLGKWYLHLFDVTQADLNWKNPEVREELKEVIRFWKAKGVKGFRFDVVNLISKPEIWEDDFEGDGRKFYTDGPYVHEYLKELVRDTGIEDYVTVGEMSSTTLEHCIRYSGAEEKELSMCFNFHHLKVDYKDGNKWELMEPDYMELKVIFEKWQMGMQRGNAWNALFWCNHDQPRIVSRFGNEGEYWKESAKMLAGMIHLMRGTPYIYQGEEIGMTNPHYTSIEQYADVESRNYYEILLNEGKTKEEALEILAARSRDNSRTPMQWTDERYCGFSDTKPWIPVSDNFEKINVKKQKQDRDSILEFYKKLIMLRKEKEVIARGNIEFMEVENAGVLAYTRCLDKQKLLVCCNFRDVESQMEFTQEWKSGRKILGNYEENHKNNYKVLTLRPYEIIVLEKGEE